MTTTAPPHSAARSRLAAMLPNGRAARYLALVALIDSCGTGMFLTGSVVFLTHVAGVNPREIGLGLAAAGVVGLLTTVPIGLAANRLGAQRALSAAQLWRGGWFVGYAFIHGPASFVVVAAMLAVAEKATAPLNQAVISAAVGSEDRVRTMAAVRVVRNVGFAGGALIGTAVMGLGSAAAFRGLILANALSFVGVAVMIASLHLPREAVAARPTDAWRRLPSLRDATYLRTTLLNAVLVLHMTLLAVGIPLWIVTRTSAPAALTGVVMFVNTVMVVLLQVRASRGCDDVATAARRMRAAGAALATCCLLLGLSAHRSPAVAIGLVLGATVLLTAGEMWQSAGSWGLSFGLAPAARRSEYLAVFSLGAAAQSIYGPALITTAVVSWAGYSWAAMAVGFGAVGVLMPHIAVRRDTATPDREPGSNGFGPGGVGGGRQS